MEVKKKYYVEFVGAHGAGKTSIFHAIAKQHMLAPQIAVYPGQIQRSKMHFALSVPILVVRNVRHLAFLISFFFRYAQFRWVNYRNVARALFKMVILHPYYDRFDFDIWLKDDMLHLVPRIIFKDRVTVEAALREYFEHFAYLYDGLVFVDIDREIMRERFKSRFPGRSEAFKKSREVIHERAYQQNQILRQVIVEQEQIPFLVLDGSEDIQENAQRASDFIKTNVFKT